MKVKELIEAFYHRKNDYPDILEWDVAVQLCRHPEREPNLKGDILKDGDGWEYAKCRGFNTYMPKEKVFTVNIFY